MKKKEYDVIIIGGGPGGLTAGIYAMRAALKTILIEKGVVGGQVAMSDGVENYPGFEQISGYELSQRFLQHAQSYGMEVIQQEVMAVEPGLDFHTVRLGNEEVLRTHTVILATGGSPRKLDIPGEDEYYGKGVSYCAVCDGFFFKEKTVVVVGGGDTATEEALYLAKLAKQVYLIHRRDALRASMILQERVKAECKIEILWNRTLAEVLGNDTDGVTGVRLASTTGEADLNQEAAGVFLSIGHTPNTAFLDGKLELTEKKFIKWTTPARSYTSVEGVFAAGDVADDYYRQAVTAAGSGCMAALDAERWLAAKGP